MISITDAQKWLILALIIFGGWLLYLLAPVLTPFLVGVLLAYLADPLVDRLEKYKLSRTLAVLIVFGVMLVTGLLMLVFLVPMVENQLAGFIQRIPDYINWLQNSLLPGLAGYLGMEMGTINLENLKQSITAHWKEIGSLAGVLLRQVTLSGQFLLSWLAFIILVPVVTFYLLRDWDLLVKRIHDLIPRKHVELVSQLTKQCDAVLAEFMRGQLLVMFCQGVIYSIGLWIVGLEFSLLIGMLAGLLSFIPYMGFIVGIGVASVAAIIQFQDPVYLLYVAIVFGVGQAIEGMLLSPVLVGDRIGLHPVAVIFAVMAGGQLFGFFGILLALPAAAVIVVLLRYLHEEYKQSDIYST